MSELCLSGTSKSKFSSLILSDFFLFCSFIISHPLYFSYFIFFSPYLLKLLSFLSPLFITTTLLLLLAFLTVSPGLISDNSASELSESKLGFLLSTYRAITERLQSKADDETEELDRFEELEAYGIVFDTIMFDVRETPVEDLELKSEENCLQALESPVVPNCSSEEKAVKTIQPVMEEKSLEGFLKVLDEFENIDYNVEEKKVEPAGTKSNKIEEHKEESMVTSGSEAMGNKLSDATVKVGNDNGRQYFSKVTANSESFGANVNGTDNGGDFSSNFMETSGTLCSNLGRCGSMRKEKEWKRTLACKLFEERHNVAGGEGMDLLWETYETDSSTAKPKSNSNSNSNSNSKKKNKNKGEIDYYDNDDEEEEEEMDGQLCCLQALKFSARKMNLGMGRPNLVKISKAIKGIGWLHHVTRGGKKGYK